MTLLQGNKLVYIAQTCTTFTFCVVTDKTGGTKMVIDTFFKDWT